MKLRALRKRPRIHQPPGYPKRGRGSRVPVLPVQQASPAWTRAPRPLMVSACLMSRETAMSDDNKHCLKLRRVGIDTFKETVVYPRSDCHSYRSAGFQALSKVEIHIEGNGHSILAVLNIVDDPRICGPEELGLGLEAFAQLQCPEGTPA